MITMRQALQNIRARVANGTDPFICFAVTHLVEDDPDISEEDEDIYFAIEHTIRAGISYTTVEHWLFVGLREKHIHHRACVGDWDIDDLNALGYLVRLAWLDRLIEEHST